MQVWLFPPSVHMEPSKRAPCPRTRRRRLTPPPAHAAASRLAALAQGWFKFGGVEFFKINITASIGEQAAWNNRTSIYLAASAMAEFIADIFLCPCALTPFARFRCPPSRPAARTPQAVPPTGGALASPHC